MSGRTTTTFHKRNTVVCNLVYTVMQTSGVFSAKGNQLQTAKTTIGNADSCLNYRR